MGKQPEQLAHPYALERSRGALDVCRVGGWSALLGSVLYVGVFTLEGLLRPDYQAASMFISELALGPWGWIQTINFILFGLSIFVFAMSVALEFGAGRAARVGVTLLVIIAIGTVASGLFAVDPVTGLGPTVDPVGVAPHRMSFHSKFHYIVGTMIFLLAPASCLCFVVADRFSKDPAWQAFRLWSLGLAVLMVAGMVFLKIALLPPASNPLLPWRGLIERASVFPFAVWLFTFGLVMLRRARLAPS